MKINIGPYKNWFGPYQLAELILFWKDKNKVSPDPSKLHPDYDAVHNLGEKLASIQWLTSFLTWVDSKKKRKIKIRIDNYDVWSMDHTLSLIIVPMLKKLKEQKHGCPDVDDEDVPEDLRSTAAAALTEAEKNCGITDENWSKRWDWVLDEMIWTFEQHANDQWEDQYHSGEIDYYFEKTDNDVFYEMKTGPKHTFKVDREGVDRHRDRMNNGRRLFAKYYESLWD